MALALVLCSPAMRAAGTHVPTIDQLIEDLVSVPVSAGVTCTFGSIFNNVVNTRF
jgi:hypothetical protein